jgi:2-polyprenyl-3-methyl-5-hydroxy-6-metoxy-1,4-benzoquinol methylase
MNFKKNIKQHNKWNKEKNNQLNRTIYYTKLPKNQHTPPNLITNLISPIIINNIKLLYTCNHTITTDDANYIYVFIGNILKQYLWKNQQCLADLCKYLYTILEFEQHDKKTLYKNIQHQYQILKQTYNIHSKLSGVDGNQRGLNRVKSIQKLFKYNNKCIKATYYLDIGCFDGNITQAIGHHFKLHKLQIHGIDIANFNKVNNITFTECSNFSIKLPFSDNSFDLITCLMTLHHIPEQNISTMISELYRVMKFGGTVILREHNVNKKIEGVGLDIMHSFYDNVWNESNDSWNDNEIKDTNYKSSDAWHKLFIENKFTPHIQPKIYKNDDRNPFMTYMCTYQKLNTYKIPSNLFRILSQNMPRKKYYRRTYKIKNTLHWGQRKLLLSEIEFLTIYFKSSPQFINKEKYVVYAGSAPGTHILYLSNLFPQVHFELYDPREFDKKLNNNPMINIHVQYFTDETASEWVSNLPEHNNKVILLISDIRTGDTETMDYNEVEERVKTDHEWQQNWYNIIKPQLSMFKFRLPWQDGTTTYMDGNIHLQAYPPITSTETRLIVCKNAKQRAYDNRKYEDQLFYFNTILRINNYNNLLDNIPPNKKYGLKNTYDYATEVYIITQYLKTITKISTKNSLSKKIITMVGEISSELSKHRTLYSPQPLKEYKKNIMKKLQQQGFIPKKVKFNQQTFNTFIIPRYAWFVQQQLIKP